MNSTKQLVKLHLQQNKNKCQKKKKDFLVKLKTKSLQL